MAGDTETAVMVMRMEQGLDTGPVCLGEQVPIGADADRGRAARRAGAARRFADGARAGGAGTRLARLHAAGGRRRHLRQEDRQGRGAHRFRRRRARRCTTSSAACRRFPAPGSKPVPTASASASRCCAPFLPTGSGTPGTVLDDQLTVACGSGAVRLIELQRAGKKPATDASKAAADPVDTRKD